MQQQEHHKESHYFSWAILETKAWRLTNRGHIPATSNKVNKSPISFTTQVSWLNSGRRSDPLVGNLTWTAIWYEIVRFSDLSVLIWKSYTMKTLLEKRFADDTLQFLSTVLRWDISMKPFNLLNHMLSFFCQGHSGEHVMLSVLHEMRSWFKSFWFKS